MKKNILIIITFFTISLILAGCSENTELSQEEILGFNQILSTELFLDELTNITSEVLSAEITEKFPAVKKIYTYQDKYLFVSKPVGYNGPMTMTIVIDDTIKEVVGIEIIEHVETEHYVRDFQNDWFTDRFTSKTISSYLDFVHLEAKNDNEIVIITGATTTTEGVVLGVNACIGLYNEYFLGNAMPKVRLEAVVIN